MAKNSPQDLLNRQIFSNTLNQLMKSKGVRQIDLHNALGIPKSTLTGYVKGLSLPTAGNVQKLADYFGIKKSELDSRFATDHTTTPTKSIENFDPGKDILLSNYSKLTTDNKKNLLSYSEELLSAETNVDEALATYDVETVTRLAAGLGYGFDDADTDTVKVLNEPPRHDLASIVDGDSMLPDYHDGDVVYLADRGVSSYSGEVCAVVVNDKTYLKRVYSTSEGLRLVSINPAYDDILIDFPPSDDTHIKIFSVIGTDRTI